MTQHFNYQEVMWKKYTVMPIVNLKKLINWFCANKLTLNVSKTKYILFREKKEIVNFDNLNLKIDGNNIDRIGMDCQDKYFRYVGFLNWDYHIKHVRNKLSSAV